MNKDHMILRELASRYFEIANGDQNKENILLHKKVNGLKNSRPVVLIDEIPWHEMNIDDELTLKCEAAYCRNMEWFFRTNIYKWNHMRADMVLRNYFNVGKVINTTGMGIATVKDEHAGDTQVFKYVDQFACEDDLEKLKYERITYDEKATKDIYNFAADIIGDILPVKISGEATGYGLGCKNWDDIVSFKGLDTFFIDLIEKEDLMHKLVDKLTNIFLDKIRQYDELGLFDGDAYYIHSTSALTNDLVPNQAHVRAKDIWGRGLAQIFASVSPEMHDEFDIQYMIKAMAPFGLVYYGCCEPLDKKIGILEKIPNLRKISITPWADVDNATEIIKNRYVVASKPNPAGLAGGPLDKEYIRKELSRIAEACKRNGCSCDIVLKDISTVSGLPQNLFEWEKIAMEVVNSI